MTIPLGVFPGPGAQALAEATAAGDVSRVQTLAPQTQGGVNVSGSNGETPLLIAVLRTDRSMVTALLNMGADPSGRPDQAPLAVAVRAKDPWFAEILLRAGADPNGRIDGRPAVWQAAVAERLDMIDRLAAAGADLDSPDGTGDAASIAAVKADLFAVALHLLERGSSPSVANRKGQTLGFWVEQSNIRPDSATGAAGQALVARLSAAGAWPPLDPPTVRALQAAGRWPPASSSQP